VRAEHAPAEDDRPHALVEAAGTRWLLDLDNCSLRRADLPCEHAVVELTESNTSPPPTDGADRREEQHEPGARLGGEETQRTE
jgi:hypothetical protein